MERRDVQICLLGRAEGGRAGEAILGPGALGALWKEPHS